MKLKETEGEKGSDEMWEQLNQGRKKTEVLTRGGGSSLS